MESNIMDRLRAEHRERTGKVPAIAAFAPGRIEVLGNHTDYNEGLVLSAAIDAGVYMTLSPRPGREARVHSRELDETAAISLDDPRPAAPGHWSNYLIGVLALLREYTGAAPGGFDAGLCSTLPIGAGLSSSAALEVACARAVTAFQGADLPDLELAKICRRAESEYAGTQCGLLDQISSLYGRERMLVYTDFRSLDVERFPTPEGYGFLLCNTGVHHSLVDSEYNARRASCERAAGYFAGRLDHAVSALRDVNPEEWQRHRGDMDPEDARRAKHIVYENDRVRRAVAYLRRGEMKPFGDLMFASHRSSRDDFENSCPELDFIVERAETWAPALGARLSGGGFGGSVIVLLRAADHPEAADMLAREYEAAGYGTLDCRWIVPASGACLLVSENPALRGLCR